MSFSSQTGQLLFDIKGPANVLSYIKPSHIAKYKGIYHVKIVIENVSISSQGTIFFRKGIVFPILLFCFCHICILGRVGEEDLTGFWG